jgi:phosphotransferase system HPr-like phosphotransfer protein
MQNFPYAQFHDTTAQASRIQEMVNDFYAAYVRFYITADPSLATLQLLGMSTEIAQTVEAVRLSLEELRGPIASERPLRDDPTDDVITFLSIAELTYIILDRNTDCVDIQLFDPGSVFATTVFLCAVCYPPTANDIDTIVARSHRYGSFSEQIIVVPQDVSPTEVEHGLKAGVTLLTSRDLRRRLIALTTKEIYRCGMIAATELKRQIGIADVFVEPDCVVVLPGPDMEYTWLSSRVPALTECESFVDDPERGVFIVLGGYGAGKTSLCAELLHRYSRMDGSSIAIYIALSELAEPLDMASVVKKANRLAKATYGEEKRVVAILDGIDELPQAMQPVQKKGNILAILQASHFTDKLIITARSSYFRGVADLWSLFPREGDSPLWDALARSSPQLSSRPLTQAIMLQAFNNDQIDAYVGRGTRQNTEQEAIFLEDLEANDPYNVLRRIARCPLFLSLLVSTRPWSQPAVASCADILRELIKYWLERDVTKGRSRWLLTTNDRYSFLYELAWWMYENSYNVIPFDYFDTFCRRFQNKADLHLETIWLDLQTTGFLSSYGSFLFFMIPEFMDFLVARRFAKGDFAEPPGRPPTAPQARIMLGLFEPRSLGVAWKTSAADKWLQSIGVKYGECAEPISLSPRGILFQYNEKDPWRFANSEEYIRYRVAINYGLRNTVEAKGDCVKVLVGSRFGLHLRPVMMLCDRYSDWTTQFGGDRRLQVRAGGSIADADDPMGLFVLNAPRGSIIDFVFDGSARDEMAALLISLNGSRAPVGAPFDWVVTFHES